MNVTKNKRNNKDIGQILILKMILLIKTHYAMRGLASKFDHSVMAPYMLLCLKMKCLVKTPFCLAL